MPLSGGYESTINNLLSFMNKYFQLYIFDDGDNWL